MADRAALVKVILDSQLDIARNLQTEATPVWSSLELTMAQLKALMVVSQDGPLPVSAVAEALAIGRPAASSLIDHLVHEGLTTRSEDATDRRRTNVQLTDAGHELLARLRRSGRDALGAWLEVMGDTDLAALAQGMAALAEATQRQAVAASGAIPDGDPHPKEGHPSTTTA